MKDNNIDSVIIDKFNIYEVSLKISFNNFVILKIELMIL